MIKEKCKHKWKNITSSSWVSATGDVSAKYECENCKIWLTAADVYQLETLGYIKGFQKWASVVAILISIAALYISYLALTHS